MADLMEKVRAGIELPPPPEQMSLRVNAGLSRKDVADAVPCSEQAVFFWETGRRRPRGDKLVAYVRVLNAIRAASGAGRGE